MPPIDLNLLIALDALLAEGSVAGAARRLRLSPSAMSRTLARLRTATGDALLVPAGRTLVATPYAEALRDRVRAAAQEAQAVLSPSPASFEPAALQRTFTIRTNEGFVALLAAELVEAVATEAPDVQLRFSLKPDKDSAPLRDGRIDMEIGTAGSSGPEIRSRTVLRDRFVGTVRVGHPLLAEPVTAARYAACRHVVSSRRGAFTGPVDDALRDLGVERRVAVTVPGFPDAIAIARRSDLVALVPQSCFFVASPLIEGLRSFELPVRTPGLDVALMWHPRLDGDAAQRWLRQIILAVCALQKPAMHHDSR